MGDELAGLEEHVSALDALGEDRARLFREVVGRRAPSLLTAVEHGETPTREYRSRVADELASEFDEHISGPDWEPTEHGKRVDDLLGTFLLHFPIEPGIQQTP